MSLKIRWGGETAIWDNEEGWLSKSQAFQDDLNREHAEGTKNMSYNPWPAGVALAIAKKRFPDLEVVSEEPRPKFVKDRIY